MTTDLKRTVEALLFASSAPLSLARLHGLFPQAERGELMEAIAVLRSEYEAAGHAFTLQEIAGGWRIMTLPRYSQIIEEMLKGQKRVRLSKAALEVMAVIAYRQPCTRIDIEAVRGVNCGGPLATLHERGLVRVTGRAESLGRPLLYATTEDFLSHLGINGLDDLPRMSEIENLLSVDADGDEASPEHRSRLLETVTELSELIAAKGGNGTPASVHDDDELAAGLPAEAEDEDLLARFIQADYEAEREALAEAPALAELGDAGELDPVPEPVEESES